MRDQAQTRKMIEAMAVLTHHRLDVGHAPGEATQMLIADGVPRSMAANVVDAVVQARSDRSGRGGDAERGSSRSTNNIVFGSLWLIGGIIVTAATASSGDTVIVAYGAIIGGLAQLIYGLVQR